MALHFCYVLFLLLVGLPTLVQYSGAQHSFTNPSANQYGVSGVQYQKQADQRSWIHMRQFLDELFQ